MYGALTLGFIYGTTRVFQGWHYMSHTFWAGIFVWLSCGSMALLFYGRAALEQPLFKKRPSAESVLPVLGKAQSSA
jgi:membrane-associated PAP2 superfamily phosphatase